RRAYEAFIETRRTDGAQRDDRLWLYRWRAACDERPVEALMAWGREVEAAEDGASAVEVYARAFVLMTEGERGALRLKLAELLAGLERPREAALYLAPLIADVQPPPGADALARGLLGGEASGGLVAGLFEEIASELGDPPGARLLAFLFGARGA